jgi:hypothetical protein
LKRWATSIACASPLAELIDPRFHNAVRTAVEQGILLDSIASTACESLIAPECAR